jgi:hypothetical protein
MQVQVRTVRNYANRDPDFPTRVTPTEQRSPGFDQNDVEAYIQRRRQRNIKGPGRPPTYIAALERIKLGPDTGQRIRQILAELRPEATVYSIGDINDLLGLSRQAVTFRMSGHTRWRLPELHLLATALATTLDDLINPEPTPPTLP